MKKLKVFIEEMSEKNLRQEVTECLKDINFKAEVMKLAKNKRFRNKVLRVAATGAFLSLSFNFPVLAAGPERIGSLGVRFWSYIKVIAKWGCIICGGLEILKSLNEGDTKSILKTALKFGAAYAVIVGLPWLFDEIDLFFGS